MHDRPNDLPDDLRLPSIDGLRAFEAAARLGSFERAGEALHITASAVSKRVGTLEDLLGTTLLARSSRGALSLSAAGREYLPQVRQALAALAAVPLHRRGVQRQQRLRVCAPPTFARQVLVPQLQTFTDAHPDIELEVVLSIPFLGHSPEGADVEIRNGNAAADGLPPLLDDVVLPMAAPALLDRLPPLRRPADLAHAPLLRTPVEPWAPWFEAAGLAWPEPSSGPKLLDLGLTLEAAVCAQGVALGRPTLARHWLDSGALVMPFALTARPVHQYYLCPHAADGAAAEFAAWLVGICDEAARRARESLSRRA